MAKYWKEMILAKIQPIWRDVGGRQQFCGVCMDPRSFLPLYLQRFLQRRELEGDLPTAGNYEVVFKVNIAKLSPILTKVVC